ncbi:MAG: hypothetical protein ABSA71_15450 [Desulfomonilia bacterium]|jgi:hypothetical protein
MAEKLRAFTLYIEDIKLRKMKAIAAYKDKKTREIVNEMFDLYLAKFAETEQGKQLMASFEEEHKGEIKLTRLKKPESQKP